ncbi:MAG: S9 family peptidase [Acidobacteria bacterium]|nr:S9 family peptidase [Acidobacteriota bacterium]
MKSLLLALLSLTLAAQKRPVTHEDIFLMKRVGEPLVSPDGTAAVFPVNEPAYDAAQSISDLWLVPTDGSAPPRRLTFSKGAESGVAWAPDGKRLAFTAKREGDEVAQIYVLSVSGGEAQRVTASKTAVSNPKWSPDGTRFLYESTSKDGPASKSTARVYDAMPIRYWNAWLDDGKPRIYVTSASKFNPVDVIGASQLAASPGFAGLNSGLSSESTLAPVWDPGGTEIVFVAVTNKHQMMTKETEAHLFRVAAAGGEPAQLTAAGTSSTRPRFAPDGKTLFFHSSPNSTAKQIFFNTRLGALDWPAGNGLRQVTREFDRSVGAYSISKDSSTVLFDAEDNGFVQLFRVKAAGGKPELLFEVREGGYSSAQYASDGALVGMYSSSTQPAEIARIGPAGHKLLSDFNGEKLSGLDMPKPVHFWMTAKNGKKIHSLLVPPPALETSKKYPLLVFPHGGPNAMSADAFSTRWNYHLLTAPGYALLMTNYTGSTGFGEKFADGIERDVLRGPAMEILEAVEIAKAMFPYLDGTRQCALGASYGGYLMNWLNGHTKQFKCIVNHAGAVNNESQYGVNDGGLARELRMGGPVWKTGTGQWMDQSPFRYAAEWQTPTLITQGEIDFRVPVGESITTFKLLQRQGVPSRLVVFPDEGHWILKGENNRKHMQEVMDWLKRFL